MVLNLVPVIQINSTWSGLVSNVGHSYDRWGPQERVVLSNFFSQHPLVFPVLGLTFTWGKVLCVFFTAPFVFAPHLPP